ncbi:class I histocompatibility antigen, F10 alpha chain-like [Pygocentrus nattereri]|uniref:class I histocompatibility antigen, F10 alpha chain-like n=1 Tax=Pygocentrus nattereri TaxID=42514 RepID=UPI0018916711|nr:class I histocompatibility antigen, F10 alpha chain-like [Pygocentrus nattereri]
MLMESTSEKMQMCSLQRDRGAEARTTPGNTAQVIGAQGTGPCHKQLLHQTHSEFHQDTECVYICSHGIFSRGFNLPEYIERNTVNDIILFYYDSNMDSKMPRPDWINSTAGQWHWNHMNLWTERNRLFLTLGFESAINQFNKTGSLSDQNVYQASGCCYLYPNGAYRTSLTHIFNGKDFLSLDVDRKTFVAAVHQAVVYKRLRDGDEVDLQVLTNFYNTVCLDGINVFKNTPKVRLRKVPEVRIFEKQKAGSITVTCHVTGFYPRAVQVDWLGPDLQPVDEGVTDVLPNEDGTYQTRKSVTVPEEDVGKHTYSCVVLHSSVEHNITTVWVVGKRNRFAVWTSLVCTCLLVIGFGFCRCFELN